MSFFSEFRPRGALSTLLVLVLIAGVCSLPFIFRGRAAARSSVTDRDISLPNYDIREDKGAVFALAEYRSSSSRSAADVADLREGFARAESLLRERVPTLKIEYNTDIRIPEVIAPDVKLGKAFLSSPSGAKRVDALREFLRGNNELIGLRDSQVDELKVAADYTNPDGNLSFVELNQEINGIPVFRGEVKAGFTKAGEIIRVINNLAPGIDGGVISADFGEAEPAVTAAASHLKIDPTKLDIRQNTARSTGSVSVFGTGDSATTAEKMYFPTEPGVVVPAWRVLIWEPANAYYVIVDTKGTMLWRKNITEDQTQAATYGVYANASAMINVAHSPFPFSPGPTSPSGQQGIPVARTGVTRIGNEPPYSFNNLGWIPDGAMITDGNAIQAGLDRDGVDGVDSNSEAFSPTRTFTFDYNPLNPNTNTGDAPVPANQTYPGSSYQQGIVTQMFYTANWFHDETYRLGFTEAARNFQNVNFTGQGVGGDRVRGEGQDSLSTNNANFTTPADGGRGRMQMYIFTGPNPDVDGALDADVVIHEHMHGLSNRLHGNSSGLFNDMSRGMGEGWSDFYGMAMLSSPTDPIDGLATNGAYVTYLFQGETNNAYYGIRRFPTAIKTALGGPNNLPHNPLTFADIDSTQLNISDGAFAPRPVSGNSDAVHNAGEIWCVALWEIRARMIQRLGWEVGNRRILQLVMDGMKLAPLSPTPVSERDAIVAAALASGVQADVADIWAGFATRGLGASTSIQHVGGTSIGGTGTARVTEAFDLPNLTQSPAITINDSAGNGNGVPEPGEALSLTIPLTNATGTTASGISLQVVGGGSANYGNLLSGLQTSRTIAYTVPAGLSCGGVLTLTLNINSSLGPATITRTFALGTPNNSFIENFDSVTPPAVPAGWNVTSSYGPMTFASTSTSSFSAPYSVFAADLPDCVPPGCPNTNGGSTELTSPFIFITSGTTAATVAFSHKYNTEFGFDGGVMEISIGGSLAPFEDIITAGGTFLQNGYNAGLGVSAPNPLGGRNGWTGDSGGYLNSIVRLPPAAAGQPVKLRWRFGADSNMAPAGGGWNVDSVRVAPSYVCFAVPTPTPRSRADFDGDGRTDLSIFRPSDGNWWLNRSTAGVTAINFGLATDIPTPGDYDGDGKAEIAVWRPSNGGWYRINSSNGTVSAIGFGLDGDIPQPGDFDGDQKDDISIFRPSTGFWWRQDSSTGQFFAISFGLNGDKPSVGDYDADGKSDLAVFRPSTGAWYIWNSSNGQVSAASWGSPGDIPANADFDGDNRDDIAVFRPSNGGWYILRSSDGQAFLLGWGLTGDVPVAADYNGDGRDDIAVYRAGTWYIYFTSGGTQFTQFGNATDIPIPRKHIP